MHDRNSTFGIGWRSLAMLIALLAAVSLVGACARRAEDTAIAHLGVPGHLNQHVSAASDGESVVALAWAASSSDGTDIVAAVSVDGGESFSRPVRVNTVERQANVNGEQPPRVAIARGPDGRPSIVVLWTARGEGGTALVTARSTDGGRTFGPTTALPGVTAAGNRGWESLVAGSNDRLFALWLDHRDAAQGRAHTHHQHGSGPAAAAGPDSTDGAARAQRSQLFVGSLDGAIAPRGIARGVCYCCRTALATGRDGAIYAAWRHVYAGNQRDVAFTQSRDGGRSFAEPVRVSEDGWQLDGCPENGPALSVTASNHVHVVWPTLVRDARGETLRLFHASSRDGRRFTPRVELPTSGAAYHPQIIVLPDGSLLAAWDELAAGKRHVRVARGEPDAGGGFAFALVTGAGELPGAYPALAVTASHAVVAWAQPGETESWLSVRRIAHPR
jgi:hypothetical protein